MARPLAVIAAGGTGGHMFPAQALAEELLARGWDVRLSTDARGARYAGGFPQAVRIAEVASATFARGGLAAKLGVPWRIAGGVRAALSAMRAERPQVVIGFGGYPSIPALTAAAFLRIPRMLHEQNGVLGRVNTLFARRVDLVACGTWPTELPRGVEAVYTGNPVRAAVLDRAGAPYIPPGDYPMRLVVFGGSQGARVISERVPGAVAALPPALRDRLRVSHQARDEDAEAAAETYAAAGVSADIRPFFQGHAGADGRGTAGDLPLRRLYGGGSFGDRAALYPDPLCRCDGRSPDGECPRAGARRRGRSDPRGPGERGGSGRAHRRHPRQPERGGEDGAWRVGGGAARRGARPCGQR